MLESARKTLLDKPLIFDEKEKALNYFKKQVFDMFKLPIDDTLKRSRLLETITQRWISDF